MDRKVFDWLGANLGRVLRLTPHARWRTGWDAEIECGGEAVALYIRGPRGNNYVSPIDMRQEAAIHRAFLAGGIPAPRVMGLIDDPCSLVLERIAGRINTETIDDPAVRRRVREEFVAIIARLHRMPHRRRSSTGSSDGPGR
jgi:aminoglycoside phosphotransferase (APT) family kinase protein